MNKRVEEYVCKYGIDEEGKDELLKIMNESLCMIGEEIMRRVGDIKGGGKSVSVGGERRYKSKKAEEYAREHGIERSEFRMLEISKKDVENLVRERAKRVVGEKAESVEEKRLLEVKRERVICSGINKKGESCKSVGSIKPEGAKRMYCFRHAEDYRSFECETEDSSESEEEKEE